LAKSLSKTVSSFGATNILAFLALSTLGVKEIEIILFVEVPFLVGLNKVVSLRENKICFFQFGGFHWTPLG
jgi:hypothetical protein